MYIYYRITKLYILLTTRGKDLKNLIPNKLLRKN